MLNIISYEMSGSCRMDESVLHRILIYYVHNVQQFRLLKLNNTTNLLSVDLIEAFEWHVSIQLFSSWGDV